MNPNWQKAKQIFSEALELEGEEREEFVRRRCAGRPGLCEEILSLLRAHETQSPLDRPLANIKTTLSYQPPSGQFQGKMIGPYRIIQSLGSGGMGTVFLAERDDEQFSHRVALKLIPGGITSENQTRRFLAERQILANLNHRHIAKLLDGGITEHGQPWFAMEYIDGMPIDRFCDQNKLSITQRLELFRNVCEAVQYAHQQLVVHRDLKPSNILVKENGTVKLLDFGIAKIINPDEHAADLPLTQTGLLPLTPAYASPEQVCGDTITTASDIYQLGVVLYELLSGCRPYEVNGHSPSEIERIVCHKEPTRPSTAITSTATADDTTRRQVSAARHTKPDQLKKHLKGDLDTIVLKTLRKEPERRYESADKLASDIGNYLSGNPVLAYPDSYLYRTKKFISRHKTGVASAAAILILLIGYAITITWHSQQTEAALLQVQQEAAKSEQVTNFLMGMFEASRPGQSMGDDITARELLELSLEDAEMLDNQPEIQGQMYEVVGRVYQSLGQYVEAEQALEKSLLIRTAHFGAHHPETARSLHFLGSFHHRKGDYDEAENMFRQALDIRQDHFGTDHTSAASSLNGIAEVLHSAGDFDQAEAIYREVLQLRRELLGEKHADVNSTLHSLGNLLQDRGRHEEAEVKLRESLEIVQELKGERHLDTGTNLISLALLLWRQGKLEEAEMFNRQGLDIYRDVLDDDHPFIAAAINNLAVVLYEQEDYNSAIPLYYEALERYRAILGEDHPGVATMIDNLGASYSRSGNLRQAESLYRQSLAMRLDILDPEHPDVGGSHNNLGSVLRRMGQFDEAEKHLNRAIEIRREKLGDSHPALARSINHLARLYLDLNKPAYAEPLIRNALAIRKEAYAGNHPEIAESQNILGACLIELGNYEEAELYLLEAFALLEENKEMQPRHWQETLENLIYLYQKWQLPDQALAYETLLNDLQP